jgi:flavin reductase (DIM6/NTAB) family NADH-FMN oxidoreductase RutF
VRQAFQRIATNVAVITTQDGDILHGMTANAWSEGTDPPLVLLTLRREAKTYKLIKSSGVFAVNLLNEHQEDLAIRFARPKQQTGEVFEGIGYRTEATGSPILDGCVAFFDCEVEGSYPFGNYDIITGQAQTGGLGASNEPLVFYGGRFVRLAPGEIGSAPTLGHQP